MSQTDATASAPTSSVVATKANALQFAIWVIGLVVFTGLAVWDTQRIKEMYLESDPHDALTKKALMGTLALYLDIINLIVMLLQLVGQRRE